MRELAIIARILVVVLCVVNAVKCQDVDLSALEVPDDAGLRNEELDQKKDGKTILSGGSRRTAPQASSNATRDSQLLSLLAARRRQLLTGRLATHINTLASLGQKNRHNTTFAQLEVRESNSSVVKRLTFDTNSSDVPTLKLFTTDGTREVRQEVKPHEVRHLFIPKVYHDVSRSRAGFLNNRKNYSSSTNKSTNSQENITELGAVYISPEKLNVLEKEVELDPEEEFQVDESNHGLYLLNYSDNGNITVNQDLDKNLNFNNTKENKTEIYITEAYTEPSTTLKYNSNEEILETIETSTANFIANSTDYKKKPDTEKLNTTSFISDELYNHFRPLETELPVEDMAPFIYFGQKLAGQSINDNLTNSPSLSASTKSVNFIIAPPERRKFNSRYSATEKIKNSSLGEEEVNEDMDVSVVKNIIEKNKVRNTAKGPAPARQVGLVNAYRKYTTTSTLKPLNIAQMNITDPIIANSPVTMDKIKINNSTDSTILEIGVNQNNSGNSNVSAADSVFKTGQGKVNSTTTTPRNYTRSYFNLRRRPARVTATSSTENIIPLLQSNATTEKASTLVYTAVVTSVSITSSMKGTNKTEGIDGNGTAVDVSPTKLNSTIRKDFETTTASPTTHSTMRPYKHRIRIRTTTTESIINTSPLVYVHRATDSPVASELSTRNSDDLKNEATSFKISDRLAHLYGKPTEYTPLNSTGNTSIKPKNILRRRRPTTTTTTTTTSTTTTTTELPTTRQIAEKPTTETSSAKPSSIQPTTLSTTETTFVPFVVTSRTSSKSSSKPLFVPNSDDSINGTLNTTLESEKRNEEVVIEAEKTYTASYILAGVGFLPVAAIVAFVFRTVMNKKTKEIDTDYEGYFDDSDVKKESPIIPVTRPQMPPTSKPDKKWEFPRNKLRLQTLLGQGNFGQVWKAEADDLTGHDGLTRLVAVKSIKETASQKEKQELLHEIYIMQKIGNHPNVVTLLACCTEQEPYLLIMEYVMCGKLLTYLRERRSRPDRFSGSGALTSRDLTVFAYCVARGMDYIASKGIVHRDLAARNVLVDHNKLCKIADFGLSRAAAGGGGEGREGRGEGGARRHALPVRWMAPEALLYDAHNHETDVWAFGILLWEIVTLGSTPYAAMSGREVLSAVTEGYRLERPPHCKPQLYRAMHSCWHADSSQRPSFGSLKAQLAELLDNEPAEGNYVDLDSFYQESSVYSDPSAIIHDEDGLSAEYDRERRCFRELSTGPPKFENRAFNFRDEELRSNFGIGVGTPRMGGFGIRDVPYPGDFDRAFDKRTFENFSERSFGDRNFGEKNFGDAANFGERKEKLSTSSFHREREKENPLVSRNSFSGFPRIATRDAHFQLMPDGRSKRVPEFECDI